jgi:anti-sigma factor RsiW
MSDRPYITCRELIEFLYLYLSGELPAERFAEFERHLAVCPSCVEYIESYRATVALAKRTLADPDRPGDETVPEDLVAAILAVRPKN